MNETYKDKAIGRTENDQGSLHYLVNKEFKNIEKKNGLGYRDDQEIRQAGINICNQIISEIKDSEGWKLWALDPLITLRNELRSEYNKMKGRKVFTNNSDKIHQIAERIDNAEGETLKRYAKERIIQDSRDIVAKGNESYQRAPMFIMESGNTPGQLTGNIIFTKESNPVKIHEALKGLFDDNPDIKYEIDYSNCESNSKTGRAIKNKMLRLIGAETCYLCYDKEQQTYTLRDKNGIGIAHRAYIWEGVKLIPAGVRERDAHVEQKKQNETIGNYDETQLDSLKEIILKDMPSAKELSAEEQEKLISATENRIAELLRKAKELGYELEPECVTKKWLGKGHVELHLNSGSSEIDWTVWGNDGGYNETLGEKLDNFIDSNEGEYITYLTKRVVSKREELAHLTKTEIVDVGKKRGITEEERTNAESEKQQMLYGISQFERMVDNYRVTEGESLDEDDNRLVQIKKLIHNAKASIENADVLDEHSVTISFIHPIRGYWSKFKKIEGRDSQVKQFQNLKDVFFGNESQQILAVRHLGAYGRILDNTETSYLKGEIELSDKFEVKDPEIQKCVENINNYFSESIYDENGEIIADKKAQYDELYEKAKKEGTDSLIDWLQENKMLPKNWRKNEQSVREGVNKLKGQLNSIESQINNYPVNVQTIIDQQHEEKLKLQQKSNKTEDDIKRLQVLTYLESNVKEQKLLAAETIDAMKEDAKYGDLSKFIKLSLFEPLSKLGGLKGDYKYVYEDITGYGLFNLSDENAKLTGEIASDLAIIVALTLVTGGVGAGAIAKMLNVGSKVARAAKWVKLADNISKSVRLITAFKKAETVRGARKIMKIANAAGKLTLGTTIGTGLLIEGTTFNAASNTIHSATNGTSLDNLNLNPFAVENIQTAAFFGALSISGKLTQSAMRLGGKTKLSINLMEGLKKAHLQAPAKFTAGLVSEMGSMLAAEQTINFVLGHDVIDPETGEVATSHAPTLPTDQEWIQMVGMILAFKMVKPGLWHKYEQKLNDGTLEICRSVKPNEILVRNPKTGEIVERINPDSINGNNKGTGTESVAEKPKDSPTKDQEAIRKRQQELINKKQLHEKRKSELNKRKAELESEISRLSAQREANWRSLDGRNNNIGRIQEILQRGNIITIDGLKYKFNGVKNGKAEFTIDGNAKKSAETSGKSYSEKVEVSSLEELLSSNFNLEPGNKGTNRGRYDKLNKLIGEAVEPLDRLQNKIRNKKAEIKTLEEEIARLEKGNNTIAKNDYFEQHKNEIVGKNVRIDGEKYRAEHINKDGTVQFKEVDGNRNFTVSSFKQLAGKGQVNGFSDGLLADGSPKKGSETLTKSESDNHKAITDLISGESEYLSSRNIDQTINQKRTELQSAQQELRGLEEKLPASQTRQQAIDERAKKGEELNKKLRKLKDELDGVNRELGEADRLIQKYQDEIDGIEKELPTEQQSKEREVVKPDIEGNISPESVQKTHTQKEILSESMGSDLHEEWRKGRLKEDGTYEPRIKETKDTEWISKNGTNQVDIANTKFEDLPSDWKYENLEAAKVAVDLVYEKILKGESISPKTLEEMSSKVHEERLKRNSWAKGGELDVPYDKLPEVEKAKDRNQVLQAIEKVGGKEKRVEIENLFNNLT